MSKWIPVSKQKPPMGNCLVYLAADMLNCRVHSASYHPNVVSVGGHFDFDAPAVTHWMPLPAAPSEPQAGRE